MRYEHIVYYLGNEFIEKVRNKMKPYIGEDVALLGKTRVNCGKPSILADYWMRRICNMSKSKITKYVNNYKKGMLNPYQYEPKERDIANENGFMNEDEENFIGEYKKQIM